MFKKVRTIVLILVVFLFIFAFLPQIVHFLTDLLWFNEIGYEKVFLTYTFAKFAIGAAVFLIVFLLSFFTLRFSTRYRPSNAQAGEVIDISPKKIRNLLILLPSVILGLFSGIIAAGVLWQEILLFLNQEAAGVTDAVFGRDISFYFFSLSLLESVFNLAIIFLIVIAVFNIIVTMYMQGFNKNAFKVSGRRFTGFITAFFVLLSLGFVIRIFNLLYSTRGIVYGAGYIDLKVSLPMYALAALCCLISAISMGVGLRKGKIHVAFFGPILLVAVLVLGYSAEGVVQKFIVHPDELAKESPYIARNIEATNEAYGLADIEEFEISGEANLTAQDLQEEGATVQNIRITDYRPTLQIYNQLQVLRYYYSFVDVDIDRYEIDGTQRQVFIAARELDQSAFANQTWINKYLKYTHGYGAVLSPVNEVTSQGQPELWIKDLPPTSGVEGLTITRPEIYFGELTNDYVLVNTDEPEFDYPIGESNAETFYEGTAGIKMNFANRILFTLDKANYRILFSGLINSDSKILLNRNINERVQKIAPFLIYDNEPYLVINEEGRLFWILNAYTASDKYPYSEIYTNSNSLFNGKNYVRNSVKITVDAYNGDVNFYIIDEEDPIVQSYANIFPTLFKDIEQMPQDLRSHLQYPTSLLNVQSEIYENYHMKNTTVFYNKEDSWSIAKEIYGEDTVDMEPYYVNMCLPNSDELEYLLIQPFTPYQKDNMVAWLAVRNDGENYGDMVVLTFPKQSLIYGPMQIENRISNDSEISQNLSLWNQQGSSVIRGDLVVVPINDSVIYVEPIYLTASTANSLPEIVRIIVAYDDQIVMARTLDEALSEIFNADISYKPDDDDGETEVVVGGESIAYDELVRQINEALAQAKASSQAGDWSSYGDYLQELEDKLNMLDNYNGTIKPVSEEADDTATENQAPETIENAESNGSN